MNIGFVVGGVEGVRGGFVAGGYARGVGYGSGFYRPYYRPILPLPVPVPVPVPYRGEHNKISNFGFKDLCTIFSFSQAIITSEIDTGHCQRGLITMRSK